MEENKILRLTAEDVECAWKATFFGLFLHGQDTSASKWDFMRSLVVRCAGDGDIPNNGELVAAAIARAYLASRGIAAVEPPPGRSLAEYPPRKSLFLWSAVWRFAGREPSAAPLAAFLWLLRPEWTHDGSDDDSVLFTVAEGIVEDWRPAQDAFTLFSPLRAAAYAAGMASYNWIPPEFRAFVDALAPFGPEAFKKVLSEGGGW